ncbi:MAG: hypothetical protein GC138_07805 [Gammaproteobacteria bacterium]|nr:hypothetical protein [Gammaproteobacteria bacterium]
MKQTLQRLEVKYARLNNRERVLTMGIVIVLLYAAWDAAMMSPMLSRQQTIYGEISELGKQMAMVDGALKDAAENLGQGDKARLKARIEDLRAQVNKATDREHEMVAGFVSPDEVPRLLQALLKSQTGLHLTKLENLPVKRISAEEDPANPTAQTAAGNPAPTRTDMYQHGVRLTVEGNFVDILNYLKTAEAMPWQIYWDRIDYTVVNYPKASATITAHTLSLKEAWIGV